MVRGWVFNSLALICLLAHLHVGAMVFFGAAIACFGLNTYCAGKEIYQSYKEEKKKKNG